MYKEEVFLYHPHTNILCKDIHLYFKMLHYLIYVFQNGNKCQLDYITFSSPLSLPVGVDLRPEADGPGSSIHPAYSLTKQIHTEAM